MEESRRETKAGLWCRARQWVAEKLNFDKPAKLSLFETTIRIVGGLLSAYDLSEDGLFLDKAQKLVDMLMPVFSTAVTGKSCSRCPHLPVQQSAGNHRTRAPVAAGIPSNVVYINQGESKKLRTSQLGRAAIAEFGSLQLEFVALSQRTANTTYGEKAEAIVKHLHDSYPDKARRSLALQLKATGAFNLVGRP